MSEQRVPYTRDVSLTLRSSLTIKGKPAVSFRWVLYIQPMGVEVEEEDLFNMLCALPISRNPQVQVDSHTGPDENSDTAFHFGVPCGQAVKINSRQDGS
ncbi:galectin-10-like [Ovis aries]|uniref:galectin-10-like n=1 Tax=Ovis aries TaxID=9940 RepID=UPI0029526F64|nr:galectin-10-like [Ovis aries]